jgi:prepilin-type N-terminal cleavage/methylation domain-containing protein
MRQRGYTLTEILVVIGIMVLVLGMATVAFSVLTGSRSAEAAENQLSATLGRARNLALASSTPTGVLVAYDPAEDRSTAILVQRPAIGTWILVNASGNPVQYTAGQYVAHNGQAWVCLQAHASSASTEPGTSPANWRSILNPLEQLAHWDVKPNPADPSNPFRSLVTDADALPLSRGLSVQALNPSPSAGGDEYLATGLVLFDGEGRLDVGGSHTISSVLTAGQRLGLASDLPMVPTIGLVIVAKDRVVSAGDWMYRTQLPTAAPAAWVDEQTEEAAIKEAGYSLIVNRYNGTFLRHE